MNVLCLCEIVVMGCGIIGGNGILVDDYDIVCFFFDVEVIYMYEGIYEINVLVIGCVLIGDFVFV